MEMARAGNRSLRTLWVMVAVFSLPWIAALLFYFFGDRVIDVKTSNYGALVTPLRPVPVLEFNGLAGKRQSTDQLLGKWALVQLSPSGCDQPCQMNLYKLRQMRLAMAEDRSRILRLLVLRDDDGLQALPAKIEAFEGTLVAAGPPDARARLVKWLQGEGEAEPNRMYIVDPAGNLMMVYPADADPVKMLKDIKRLLQLSRIG